MGVASQNSTLPCAIANNVSCSGWCVRKEVRDSLVIEVVRLEVELQNGGSWLPVYVVGWKGEIRKRQYSKSSYKIKINKYIE